MHFKLLQQFFRLSPAIHLLRSPNAAWILSFLNQQFKQSGQITRLHSELTAELALWLDDLQQPRERSDSLSPGGDASSSEESRPELVLGAADVTERAGVYLSQWCASETGWLKRFIDSVHTEPIYQLTPETESVLSFVGQATQEQPFIGTQSRLRSILSLLESAALIASPDPQARIDQLQRQRDEIEQEISRVLSEGHRAGGSSSQMREQFSLAAAQLGQLKSEFRAVEERFRIITRDVQEKISSAVLSRGSILDYALNNETVLQQCDQGRSFFEFLKLLHAPDSQDHITRLILQFEQMQWPASQSAELESVRSMMPTLLAEAEKILRTTQHLSSTLRRLLDAKSTRHHQQLTHLLRDICSMAAQCAEHPPQEVGLEVEAELEIQSPMDRPFWLQAEPFADLQMHPVEIDREQQALALEQLVALERIDWQAMRRNVTVCTESYGATCIGELLQRFPIHSGTIEVLGYLQIAHDDGHDIDSRNTIDLTVELAPAWGGPRVRSLRLPNIIFLPDALRHKNRERWNKLVAEIDH